jgi:hypothetical protein
MEGKMRLTILLAVMTFLWTFGVALADYGKIVP